MTITDTTATDAGTRPRELSEGERKAVFVTAAAVGALGLIGFVISFATVAAAAKPAFGPLAFLLPLGVDLGIGVFSALDIVLARMDMRVRWLRFIPWTLTGATVYLNVAEQTTPFGMVAHAVLPLLWVAAVEIGAHALRKRAKLASRTRMDSIRLSRWLLAPVPTFALWRRMVLWEIRSYPAALGRERDRIMARTELQDRYGRMWRWKATRRERALYKLGELTPAGSPIHAEAVRLDPGPAAAPAVPAAERPALPAPPRRPTARKTGPASKRTAARSRRAPVDVDDLMPLGWQIAADLGTKGEPLTRDRLRDAIRQTGASISTDRAGALLARLRTEAPADPSTVPDSTPAPVNADAA